MLTNPRASDIIKKKTSEVFTMKANVEVRCPFCGKNGLVEVDVEQYEAWQSGELIQYAMPALSATQREMLITGMCEDCQNSIFGGDSWDDEPADIDDDCGFDPYEGCYTFDC